MGPSSLARVPLPPGVMRQGGGGRGGGGDEHGGRLGRAPSLRVLSLADAVGLQLVVDEVVLRFALFAAVLTREPLVTVGLRVHIEHMLAQVGGGGVDAAAERTLRPVAQGRPARQSRPCNTEAAVRTSESLKRYCRCVGRGRGRGRAGSSASRRVWSSCVSACTGAS